MPPPAGRDSEGPWGWPGRRAGDQGPGRSEAAGGTWGPSPDPPWEN